jgi:predicted N-formylglutamate amidohydrolase
MDAVELVEASSVSPALLLCCEHAAQRLPDGWSWPAQDAWLLGSHWAYDLGAAELTRELAVAFGASAVLARFTRLLVDANRPPESETLFRQQAEGRAIELSRQLSDEDRARRMGCWHDYHGALDRAAQSSEAPVLMAVHSFTESYHGESRDHVEVGVLFDDDDALAERVAAHVMQSGVKVRLNEPYSGKQGLIYSVDRHARASGKRAIEIEVRQDLCVMGDFRRQLVATLRDFDWPQA